jgi:signal transduction histidine kinase
MTLRSKLLLAQLPIALSLVMVGLAARSTIAALDHNAQDILKDNYLSVLAAQRMRDAADAMSRAALAHALQQPGPGAKEMQQRREGFERELTFQTGNITETGEREMTDRTRAAWKRFQEAYAKSIAAPPAAAGQAYFAELQPALIDLETATSDIANVNQDAMVRKSDRARHSAARISAIMVAVTLAAFALGIFASVYLTNRLTRPLSVLAQAVRRLGEGDLSARVRTTGHDEIAQVGGEFNTMAKRLTEYRSSSLGELLQAQQASQAAIDSLPDPVLVLKLGGEVLNVNRCAESLLGISAEANGDPLAGADPVIRELVQRMREHIQDGKGAYVPRSLEESVAVPTRDGVRQLLPRANPVIGEEGGVVGLSIVLQDVTRLRRFDELKTDMVATVAHEFRTPLTSLHMAIHLCTEGAVGPLTSKQADLLFAARDDCQRLQAIVDDLLDLSRIQAGKIELQRRAASSASLIGRAIDEYQDVANEAHVSLDTGAPTIDRPVLADPDRIHLVLTNLLQNAIRHTPADGQVEVRAAPETDGVRFEVRDSGPGIPPEYIPRLFERFFRIPGARSGGAGLGLYICKEIVEAHGGRIGVESDPGHGAIFWFTLPGVSAAAEVAPTV